MVFASPGRAEIVRILRYALVLLALPAFGAAPPQGDPSKADLCKLQGAWELVANAEFRLEVAGNRIAFTVRGCRFAEWTFSLDATKRPKSITLTSTDTENPVTYLGDYSLDGDTLTVCSAVRYLYLRIHAFEGKAFPIKKREAAVEAYKRAGR
jgi:uncharacterized protein (TIGR03067 family)